MTKQSKEQIKSSDFLPLKCPQFSPNKIKKRVRPKSWPAIPENMKKGKKNKSLVHKIRLPIKNSF